MELEQLKPIIMRCVSLNLPFAVYAFPGSQSYKFLCSTPDIDTGENDMLRTSSNEAYLNISFFNNEESYPIAISDELTPERVRELPMSMKPYDEPDIRPVERTTDEILYRSQVHVIKNSLRSKNHKTVLSRIIAGESHRKLTDVVGEYFAAFPDTLRYIYFTQETGLWIGASPELLLSYDYNTGEAKTMSLAGTLPADAEEWDEKNIEEQDIVTRFIAEVYSHQLLPSIEISEPYDLPFGDIKHICTIVSAICKDPIKLLHELSPTPALAGYPRTQAIESIYEYETHPRYCYGGCLTFVNPEEGRLLSFVNLRCALLSVEGDTIHYNIYTGSGLTRDSDASTEWEETTAKSSVLLSILQQNEGKKER